jgi:hypothetical protein
MDVKIAIAIFATVVCSYATMAQSDPMQETLEVTGVEDILKITIFDPGISYEKRIARLHTISGRAELNTSIELGYSDAIGKTSRVYFDPGLVVNYRYYYNLTRRFNKERNTLHNNGNFFGVMAATHVTKQPLSNNYYEDKRRLYNTVLAIWGLQRNYGKRFSLEFTTGFGYGFAKSTFAGDITGQKTNVGEALLLVDINLGFWLNKRSPRGG